MGSVYNIYNISNKHVSLPRFFLETGGGRQMYLFSLRLPAFLLCNLLLLSSLTSTCVGGCSEKQREQRKREREKQKEGQELGSRASLTTTPCPGASHSFQIDRRASSSLCGSTNSDLRHGRALAGGLSTPPSSSTIRRSISVLWSLLIICCCRGRENMYST